MNSRTSIIIVCITSVFILFVIQSGHSSKIHNDPFCNKPCNQSEDCSFATDCNICASRSGSNVKDKEKICMSQNSQMCGGPPLPPQNSSLKQYLIIGDSIARGYFPILKTKLKDVAEAHLNTGFPNSTSDGVSCVNVWMGPDPDRWDVISFNFGANDTQAADFSDLTVALVTYEIHLKNLTERLVSTKAAKKGKLIFVLTTPTANSSDCCPNSSSAIATVSVCPIVVQAFNGGARYVMKRYHNIVIDDLWGWVNLHCCQHEDCQYLSCDFQPSPPLCQVDFTGANGWEYLATNVSTVVKEVLGRH